jgi:hypothetical protein
MGFWAISAKQIWADSTFLLFSARKIIVSTRMHGYTTHPLLLFDRPTVSGRPHASSPKKIESKNSKKLNPPIFADRAGFCFVMIPVMSDDTLTMEITYKVQ